jgi:hypothetical protein
MILEDMIEENLGDDQLVNKRLLMLLSKLKKSGVSPDRNAILEAKGLNSSTEVSMNPDGIDVSDNAIKKYLSQVFGFLQRDDKLPSLKKELSVPLHKDAKEILAHL